MFGNILETLGLRVPDRTPPPAAMSYGQARAQIGPSSDPLTRVDPNDFINGPQDARPAPQAVTQEGPMPTNILQSLDQTPPEMMQPQAYSTQAQHSPLPSAPYAPETTHSSPAPALRMRDAPTGFCPPPPPQPPLGHYV